MSVDSCPVCDEEFDTAGALREHAWDAHGACQYCGESLSDDDERCVHWLAAHGGELSRADRKRAEATVDSLEFGQRLEHGGVGSAVAGMDRRIFLAAGGAAVVAGGAFGVTQLLGGGGGAAEAVVNAPLPSNAGELEYATMGEDGAALTVTYYGNWKCPACARFGTDVLPGLVEDYVQSGDVALQFRNLAYVGGQPFLGADAPDIGRAGLAVWNEAPEQYWAFHEHVFRNQPPEASEWGTPDQLASFAESAGVPDPDVVRPAMTEDRYDDALQATADAASEAGVRGTPSLVVDGAVVSGLAESEVRSRIESAL
jgi:protein-disulfide isomerase